MDSLTITDTSSMREDPISDQTDNISSDASRGHYEAGTIAAYLLKGVIYRQNDAALWNSLVEQYSRIQDLVNRLGVKLVTDDNEGYAYLRSLSEEEMPDIRHFPPRLMSRRQLSFNVSFLLLLLRYKLIEFDNESNGEMRLVLTFSELVEMISIYYGHKSDEVKFRHQIELTINKVVDLGFLNPLQDKKTREGECEYEVMRILKAYFNAETISSLNEKIQEYKKTILDKTSDEDK